MMPLSGAGGDKSTAADRLHHEPARPPSGMQTMVVFSEPPTRMPSIDALTRRLLVRVRDIGADAAVSVDLQVAATADCVTGVSNTVDF